MQLFGSRRGRRAYFDTKVSAPAFDAEAVLTGEAEGRFGFHCGITDAAGEICPCEEEL